MAQRPRIHWRHLEQASTLTLWTPGWLPDTATLRWSLANDLRIEGYRDNWHTAFEASDEATFYEGWVAEDELGDFVEVTSDGYFADGERADDWKPATFARLEAVESK